MVASRRNSATTRELGRIARASHGISREKLEQAWRAQAAMRSMLPSLTDFANSVSGSLGGPTDLIVKIGHTPMTDGKIVYCPPSMELGLIVKHDRRICSIRGEDDNMLCLGCHRLDVVTSHFMHEIAHIIANSFEKCYDRSKVAALKRALESAGTNKRADELRKRVERVAEQTNDYWAIARTVSPFLKGIANCLEDARVNRKMNEAFAGTTRMFHGKALRIARDGIEKSDGERVQWGDLPLNSQMNVGILLTAFGYHDLTNVLDERVQEAVNDPVLHELCGRAATASAVKDIYELSFDVMERARRLGFYQDDDDPEDEDEELQQQPPEQGESEQSESSDDDESAPTPQEYGDGEAGDESDEDQDDSEATSDGAGDDDQDDDGDESNTEQAKGGSDAESEDEESEENEESDDSSSSSSPEGDESEESGESQEGENDSESEQSPAQSGSESDSADEEGESEGESEPPSTPHEMSEQSNQQENDSEGDYEFEAGEELDQDDDDDDVDWGTAEEAEEAAQLFGEHDDDGSVLHEEDYEDEDEAAIELAVLQAEHFDEPSPNVIGFYIHKYGEPNRPGKGDDCWDLNSRFSVEPEQVKPPESIVNQSIMRLRRVFAENKRAKRTPHRSGRVNASRLASVRTGNKDVFTRASLPGKRDYSVLIALDVSGSTQGSKIRTIKETGFGAAELMNRLGVEFSVYAHEGNPARTGHGKSYEQDVWEVKEWNQPWDMAAKRRLSRLVPGYNNLDGHMMEFCRKMLDRRTTTDRIILYFTDGTMPEANSYEEAAILRRELLTMKKRGYTVIGVGIGTDSPRQHGLDTVVVRGHHDVPKVVAKLEEYLR